LLQAIEKEEGRELLLPFSCCSNLQWIERETEKKKKKERMRACCFLLKERCRDVGWMPSIYRHVERLGSFEVKWSRAGEDAGVLWAVYWVTHAMIGSTKIEG
jgi:hypothetical protein